MIATIAAVGAASPASCSSHRRAGNHPARQSRAGGRFCRASRWFGGFRAGPASRHRCPVEVRMRPCGSHLCARRAGNDHWSQGNLQAWEALEHDAPRKQGDDRENPHRRTQLRPLRSRQLCTAAHDDGAWCEFTRAHRGRAANAACSAWRALIALALPFRSLQEVDILRDTRPEDAGWFRAPVGCCADVRQSVACPLP